MHFILIIHFNRKIQYFCQKNMLEVEAFLYGKISGRGQNSNASRDVSGQ